MKLDEKNIYHVSTQQIQIFLKAVELKNFTQVANYFNFTPSMISKTITSLENNTGLKLFVRKPHELTPTPAALFLAKEWRQYIVSISNSITKAHAYQNDSLRKIVLGFVDSSSTVDELIGNSISEYLKCNPNINISVEKHDMHRAAELLNSGMLDMIITSAIETPFLDEHDLPWEKIYDTSAAVYIPKGNDLFGRASLTFQDLKGQPFLSLNPLMHPSYHSWLFSTCEKHGFIPHITAEFRTVRSLMFNLKLNQNIFLGDSITSDWCDDNLKMFLLPEESFTLISWRKDHTRELNDLKNHLKCVYSQNHLPA
ncbi:MAG: LysR family transcriptional regulator [Lachnospiraceae bacterium]|nr:LysR family transcriptional regulator [Lachnospiraceae bacterium]